jgi:hypothetical protein
MQIVSKRYPDVNYADIKNMSIIINYSFIKEAKVKATIIKWFRSKVC